jgi:hypothetical protein
MTHDNLRALALAATQPGPWTVKHSRHQASDVYTVLDVDGMWVADCGAAPHDAAFIAAASPDVVIALLDQLAAREQEVERLRESIRLVRIELHKENTEEAAIQLDALAASVGLS